LKLTKNGLTLKKMKRLLQRPLVEEVFLLAEVEAVEQQVHRLQQKAEAKLSKAARPRAQANYKN